MNKFKKLDKLAFTVTKKILKKYGFLFVKINENWEKIVGAEYYITTSPLKISKDKVLSVEVKSNIVLDFQYEIPTILLNIDCICGKGSIANIKIIQKF